ncbi:glycosyltransferase [Flavobacterium sp.]|uniref:glycosyltransferase n=1 Tax=Flavobacterium sp. TaxID=239 RepID=UPI00261A31EE|nr:glycosyltransferase [Flavobacterium sp.]MDD3003991.1 glycosyltransferase [Flavobacterium sp.]
MKNVFFILSYSHLGGAETRAIDIALHLKNNCIPIFIVYGKPNGKVQYILDENNIIYIERLPFNWKSKYKGLDVIFRLFLEMKFIIKKYYYYRPYSMISFCADANIFLSLANIFIQNKNTYWCQVDDFIQWRWKRIFLYAIKNSKNVISVSNFITRQINSKCGTLKKIITIPNSINPTLLYVNKKTSEKIRISIVGHINRIKNQGYAIQAIEELILENRLTDVELNLYGMISDTNYWKEIKIKKDWFFYRGYQSKNEIYNNTDILLIPSLSESFSLVLHEGNFFNLDILCSNIDVFKETTVPDLIFFELDDKEDLKKAIVSKIFCARENKKNNKIDYIKKYNEYVNHYREILI